MEVSKFKFQQKSRGCAQLLRCCIKSGGPAWHAGCSYLKTVKKWDESNVESLRNSSFSRACRWGTFDVRTLSFSTTWESTKSAMVSASPCLTRVRCLGIVFDVNGTYQQNIAHISSHLLNNPNLTSKILRTKLFEQRFLLEDTISHHFYWEYHQNR